MTRVHIPKGAWMKLRQHGSYKYSRNTPPIIWTSKAPPAGQPVYHVAWKNGQTNLMASRVSVEG